MKFDMMMIALGAAFVWWKTSGSHDEITTEHTSTSDHVRDTQADPWNPGAGLADGGMGAVYQPSQPSQLAAWQQVPNRFHRYAGQWKVVPLAFGRRVPSGYVAVAADSQPYPGGPVAILTGGGNVGPYGGGGGLINVVLMSTTLQQSRTLPPGWSHATVVATAGQAI